MTRLTYKDAGVDVEAADRFVDAIRPATERTRRPEVLGGIGGFGGLFALAPGRYRSPVLVAGTDGVGTKLKLAFDLARHDTVGIDLVAMCVNDILVVGAEPLFFLDYFATGRLDPAVGAELVKGIAEGCVQAGCALLGGETAEMPGFYPKGEYDLAGFAVGVVERGAIIDGAKVSAGDAVIGLSSSGLHSNGYSLARKAVETLSLDLAAAPELLGGRTVGDALLEPTRIYVKAVQALMPEVGVRAMAHITGGGLPGNVPRSLPEDVAVVLDPNAWARPPIFDLVATAGIPLAEQYRTFNMGLGMVLVVPRNEGDRAVEMLRASGESAELVGEVVPRGDGPAVRILGVDPEAGADTP
jgi:phosphoribosylformylglycinamidine cyclo-ligase